MEGGEGRTLTEHIPTTSVCLVGNAVQTVRHETRYRTARAPWQAQRALSVIEVVIMPRRVTPFERIAREVLNKPLPPEREPFQRPKPEISLARLNFLERPMPEEVPPRKPLKHKPL